MPDIKGATVTGIYKEADHANSWPSRLEIDEGPASYYTLTNVTKSRTTSA